MYDKQEAPTAEPKDQQRAYNNEQQGYQYQPPANPPPIDWSTKPTGTGETFDERFKVPKRRLNDWPFTIIFLATVAGFIAIAGITIGSYTGNRNIFGGTIYSGNNSFALNTNTLILFAFCTATALTISMLYYLLARVFTSAFIIGTTIISLMLAYGTAIFYLVEKYYSAGVVFLVLAVFQTFAFWSMRSRIPFASLVLKVIISVTQKHPSVLFVSFLGCLVASAFAMFFSITLISIYVKYSGNDVQCQQDGSCSQGKLVGLIVFTTFAGYYITEVIKNVIHTTICGVYGSWYYCSKSDQGMPKWPAMGAFGRSMTFSFGSICFGSLIVAFVNLLRTLLDQARRVAQSQGGMIADVIIILMQCFMGILDWLLNYFNHYAYSYIALYGKAYIPAARDTWNLLKTKGIDALINDCLIGTVLDIGALIVAYTCALLAYLYLRFTKPEYNSSGGFYPVVIAYTFLMAMQIASITNVAIRSGVSTFFVALATDPEVLQQSYPDVFYNLLHVYPDVQRKIGIEL